MKDTQWRYQAFAALMLFALALVLGSFTPKEMCVDGHKYLRNYKGQLTQVIGAVECSKP
jgi:hypothetical protein